jgi:sugar-specific transcriptional regulator TrmB
VLKGEQCLAGLITFYGQDRELISEVREQCDRFIKMHVSSSIETSLDENAALGFLDQLFVDVVRIQKISGEPLKRYEYIPEHIGPSRRRPQRK